MILSGEMLTLKIERNEISLFLKEKAVTKWLERGIVEDDGKNKVVNMRLQSAIEKKELSPLNVFPEVPDNLELETLEEYVKTQPLQLVLTPVLQPSQPRIVEGSTTFIPSKLMVDRLLESSTPSTLASPPPSGKRKREEGQLPGIVPLAEEAEEAKEAEEAEEAEEAKEVEGLSVCAGPRL